MIKSGGGGNLQGLQDLAGLAGGTNRQELAGLVFDIKRYAISDGPGIRIVVFLKGCNLNCAWCHNPEGIAAGQERMYAPARCIGCGTCVSACPNAALTLSPEGIVTDTTLCELCGTCAAVCPTKAIEMSGIAMAVEEIMNEIEKERVFIEQSGGGVTFSGGEPMLHADFLVRLLDACRERGIHTAVDTAGLVNPETLLEVAKRTDLFLYDLKLMDSDHHREWTGVPNERILANLRVLAESGANINVRIPLVGGVNDDEENIVETARFLAGLPGERIKVNLLPYHKIAQAKYAKLGKLEAFRVLKEPDAEEITRVIKIFLDFGVEASR